MVHNLITFLNKSNGLLVDLKLLARNIITLHYIAFKGSNWATKSYLGYVSMKPFWENNNIKDQSCTTYNTQNIHLR